MTIAIVGGGPGGLFFARLMVSSDTLAVGHALVVGVVHVPLARNIRDSLEARLDTTLYFTSRFRQQPISDPRLSQPGNAKLDMRLALGRIDQRWEVPLVGKNLTNKLTASYRQIVPSAVGSIAALAKPPRSIGLQVSARY